MKRKPIIPVLTVEEAARLAGGYEWINLVFPDGFKHKANVVHFRATPSERIWLGSSD